MDELLQLTFSYAEKAGVDFCPLATNEFLERLRHVHRALCVPHKEKALVKTRALFFISYLAEYWLRE
jgi:hypothetical protein